MYTLRQKTSAAAFRSVSAQSRRHSEARPSGQSSHPTNESLGPRFYASIAAIAASLAFYKFTRPSPDGSSGDQPLLTRLLHKYDEIQRRVEEYNVRNMDAAEAAAADRRLFYSEEKSGYVNLKFPEIFNTGSPRNIRAGHQPNLDALFGHYEEERDKAQTKRLEKAEKATERAKEDDTTFVSSVREALGLGSKDDE